MDFSTILILAVVVGSLIGIANVVAANSRKNQLAQMVAELPDFAANHQVIGSDGFAGLAVDEGRKKICLIANSCGVAASQRIVDYRDILSAELFEDGFSVTKTSRSSQLGGALIGGLALGGVGAIIGGLSGKTVATGKVKSIQLRLVVNDTQSPLHDVTFMDVEGNKPGIIYNAEIAQARHWLGLMDVLIKRADEEDCANTPSEQPKVAISRISVADEIKKLAELVASGALTNDEFQTQKEKLLKESPAVTV